MKQGTPSRRNRRAGFVMAELVICLVVLGLSTLTTVAVSRVQNRAAEVLSRAVDARQTARVDDPDVSSQPPTSPTAPAAVATPKPAATVASDPTPPPPPKITGFVAKPCDEGGQMSAPELTAVKDPSGDLGNNLVVTWNASPSERCAGNGLTAYRVERKSLHGTSFFPIQTVTWLTGGPYAWTDSTVLTNLPYEYRVVAVSTDGTSAASLSKSGTATTDFELQPAIHVAAASVPCDMNGAVQIEWDPSPSERRNLVTHYHVYRSPVEDGPFDLRIATVGVGASHYTVIDAADNLLDARTQPVIGNLYYYAVRAANDRSNTESQDSKTASARSETVPAAPRVTGAEDTPGDYGRSITVRFDPSSHDGDCAGIVTTYRIYRGTNDANVEMQIGTITASRRDSYTYVDDVMNSSSAPLDHVEYFYAVRAYADELVSELSNVAGPATARPNATDTHTLFLDDFEVNRGWISNHSYGTDDWERGAPSAEPVDHGNADPVAAASGSKVVGNSLAGQDGSPSTYSANSDVYIDSPKIDCSEAHGVKVRFKRWLNVDEPNSDTAGIYVRSASTAWQKVWENPEPITDSSWQTIELDISNVADGQRDVQIRFRLISNGSTEYTGWNVDDVSLIGY